MQPYLISTPWSKSSQDVVREAGVSLNGLTTQEAGQRLAQAGRNSLKAREEEPWYTLLLQQFANPLVYMLVVAAAIKAYFKGPVDAAVIVAVLIFMAVIGFVQEMKARKAMLALLNLSAPKAKVRRDGATRLLDASEIVPGDILVLETGDRIAADARLIETANLKINESTFTGESLPVDKNIHVVEPDASIHDQKNMVFMGTTVSHGRALCVVTSTGMETEIGHITTAISNVEKDITPLQRSIERLGHALIWVVLGACAALVLAGLFHDIPWTDLLLLAVAAAVSGIPEGLPAAVTVVLSICVSRMASRNVIIRKLAAVETLESATVICSDKTGTLTLNHMTVRSIWHGNRFITVTGGGYEPVGKFVYEGAPIQTSRDESFMRILRISTLRNDAILNEAPSGWDILGDPTEGSLLAMAGKAGIRKSDLEKIQPRLDEIPFESEKQFMATLHAENGQRTVYVKGSVERLLTMCSWVEGNRELDESSRQAIMDANAHMADQALRVIAVAVAPYPVELGKLDAAKLH